MGSQTGQAQGPVTSHLGPGRGEPDAASDTLPAWVRSEITDIGFSLQVNGSNLLKAVTRSSIRRPRRTSPRHPKPVSTRLPTPWPRPVLRSDHGADARQGSG